MKTPGLMMVLIAPGSGPVFVQVGLAMQIIPVAPKNVGVVGMREIATSFQGGML